MSFGNIWKGREREAAFFHSIGGVGGGLLISAFFEGLLILGIVLILISLGGHIWAFQKSKEV